MPTEILLLIAILLEFILTLSLFRFGKRGVLAVVIINIILVSTFGAKLISIFGWTTNMGNVFYSTVFLAMSMLVEKYGNKEARKTVWLSFFSLVFFFIMTQIVRLTTGLEDSYEANDAISKLFTLIPRVAFASMFAFILIQHLNVSIYSYLKDKTKGKNLGLRYILSVSIADLLDSIIFFTLAFVGTIPMEVLVQSIIVGYALKSLVTITSVPILYISKKIKVEETPVVEENEIENTINNHHTINIGKITIVKLVGLIISIMGLVLAWAWIWNVPVITNIVPNTITIKFMTVLGFIFSGPVLYFMADKLGGNKDMADIVLPLGTFVIVSIMASVFWSAFFGLNIGIENLFIEDPQKEFAAGVPALVTIINFFLFSTSSLMVLAGYSRVNAVLKILGSIIGISGTIALIGYATKTPELYYYLLQNISNPIAIPTALLFMTLGYGVYQASLIRKPGESNE